MKTKSHDKFVGWFLLTVGIITITGSAFFAVTVLTGRTNPPKVFDIPAPTIPIPNPVQNLDLSQNSSLPPEVANAFKQNAPKQQSSVKLLPDEAFSKLLNMGISYFLAMFMLSAGAKIASLGIQLVKSPPSKI